jgi:large repetitive protein
MTSRLLHVVFFLIFVLHFTNTFSQVTLQVRINSGNCSATNCTDCCFGNQPDRHWRVSVDGGGYTTYPSAGACFTDPPNTQFSQVYNCPSYPATIQVCLRAFEDDGTFCVVSQSCLEQNCQNFATPGLGSSLTYNLNVSGASTGTVNFTITASGSFPGQGNDQICNAVNLGTINSGSSIGNASLSNYNNFCATNTGDPTPSWSNEQGVWFQFTTGSNPTSVMEFDLNNDPQSAGDQIDLQVALYESSNGTCSGALTLIQSEHDGLGVVYSEDMSVNCLNPNTTYFLLVDGHEQLLPWGGGEGYFGLQINDNGVQQAGDLICDAENLGLVTAGGSVGTPALSRSNVCATNTGDPTPGAWGPDETVWFMFQAPPSGHVFIDANSDLIFPIGVDAIDLQLAVYGTSDGTCTGILDPIYSDYTPGFYDEDMDVRCLTPGENYWVMLDGSPLAGTGIFDITISDGGQYPASHDEICNAKPLGAPAPGGTVGMTNEWNYCANNLFEPIPSNWGNNMGVWYTFIAPPSGKVEVRTDIYLADMIDLQLAVYDLSGAVCTGTPTELNSEHDFLDLYAEDMWVDCLIPGREYWILVDGEASLIDPDLVEGLFDIEVYADPQDPPAVNDDACNAIALGDPTGGSVSTTPGAHGSQNNFCSDAVGEPQPLNWTADQTVWYTFVAPATGAINLELNSDDILTGTDAINLQFALYEAGACTGAWREITSGAGLIYDVDVDIWCLNTGQTYYIQVDGAPPTLLEGHEGYFDVTITEIPPIPVAGNDTICGAIALGNPWTAPISIAGEHNLCANNIGDPTPAAFGPDQTVWYTFTTPATGGPFAIDIQATSDLPWPFGVDAVDLQIAVFESSNNLCTGALTEMGSSYLPLVDFFNEFMNVRCLEEGKTYFLMVDGSFINVQGYFDLELTPATPVPIPTNDLICNNIALGTVPIGGSINNGVDYSNFCSDIEPGEPDPFLDPIEQTVWFSFIAPAHAGPNTTSNVTVNVTSDPGGLGNIVDLQLAVYESNNTLCTGTMNLVEDGSSDPVASFDASVSVTCLYPGQEYWVQIDGSILNQEGYFRIDIQDDGQGTRPTNNMMCNAIALGTVPNGGTINNGIDYTNLCTDTEAGEPDPNAFGIGKTVWFTFVAPASGNVTIDALSDPNLIGDDVDLQLAVYSSSDNTCTGTFLEVDSDYDILNKDETLNVDCLTEGLTYFLQVDGAAGILGDEDGWFTLQITDDGGTSNFPYNNDMCNAYDFGTPSGVIQTRSAESNVCANLEVGEPGVSGYASHTVWYQFTAPASGRVEINVVSTNIILGMDPEVYVHASSDNTCSGVLTEKESSFWPTALITENIEATCLIPGNVYFIQVDGQLLVTEGTFDIDIVDMIPNYVATVQPSNDSCDNALVVPVQPESCVNGTGVFQTNNYGQPTITYDPAFAQNCGGNCGDTWYQFTIPASGNAIIEGNDDAVGGLLGDYSDLTIVAYTGTCGNLTPYDCGQGGLGSDVSFQVAGTPGTTVWVQVFDDDGDDSNEDYEICISEGCGFDDCLDALLVPLLPNIPYCWNTSGMNGENIPSDPGYNECSEGDSPEQSLYFYFITDCNATDVTLSIINGQINGGCTLGINPTDGFNVSLFQDGTPCDNVPDALVDCQTFTACDVQPINWSFTYTAANGLQPNTSYVIQIDGGINGILGQVGGNNIGEVMITTTTGVALDAVSTPLTCANFNDGSASAVTSGGAYPFTYQWSSGSTDSTATGLAAGMHYVSVTGATGCVDEDSVLVIDGPVITAVSFPPTDLSCKSVCTGQGIASGMGGTVTVGYGFQWDAAAGNQTDAMATGLCAGTFSVTVSDDIGCYDSTQITIDEPDTLIITLSNPVVSNCDSSICTGGATSLVIGGTGAYDYLWSNGSTDASPTDLCPGFNAVTVTDDNTCSDSASIIITAPIASTPPIINPISGIYCPNETVTLSASGGIAGTGSTINWYTGPNGTGTLLGTGANINITTSVTSTYYVRREGTCGPTVDSSLTVNVKWYIYAANGTSTNTYCTDNNGWHHFFVGDEIILSVQGDISGAPAGFPMVTIWDSTDYYQETEGPYTAADCATGWNPGEERFEMERSWNVDMGGGTLAPPYNVRFYYQPAERAAIENAAINWMASYPACGYSYKYGTPLGFYWFKNEGSNYDAPYYDSLHLTGPWGTTNNAVNYHELQTINSFSGGSGAVILIPITLLPVDWLYFDGTTDNKINYLSWGTESEDNSSYFNVERSRDGINFEKIGVVGAQGHSTVTKHYTFDDVNPYEGANYYRLELIDMDEQAVHSNIVLLNIKAKDLAYNFFPNPTDGYLYYQYESEIIEELEIKVMDALGKLIEVKEHKSVKGNNNVPTDLNKYPPGTYMVRVHHKATGYVHVAKVIKNKF